MEPIFFEQVLDALAGSIPAAFGRLRSSVHRGGLKVWFDDADKEHYESQLFRHDGELALEIGFHAEHPKAPLNQAAIEGLAIAEPTWREMLGPDAVVDEFFGRPNWRRVSEVWAAPDLDDLDAIIEVADRLTDYITALEPCLRTSRSASRRS